ncbi:hypothetical protein QJS04_geneDACA003464 [Acorus gramineus]|uniref:Uncharacterized protein n=1 Tax=Acorus gramineus TaxID=55184 RepID=A0AAV9BQ71_ACOGR|nr:hypothetical protein QJS04_geneDACA003464 [Acorus gramineus]
MEGSKSPPRSRCPHCAGPLLKDMETSSWTISPFVRDSLCMIGNGVGGMASSWYGFNYSGALPALAQLVSSSYHAGITASSMPTASQDEKMHKSRSSSPL